MEAPKAATVVWVNNSKVQEHGAYVSWLSIMKSGLRLNISLDRNVMDCNKLKACIHDNSALIVKIR